MNLRIKDILSISGVIDSGSELPAITSIADLQANIPLLESIFATGCSSWPFLEGNHPGVLLSAGNIDATGFNPAKLINIAYNGEFTHPVSCETENVDYIVGYTNIAGQTAATGLYSQVSNLGEKMTLADGQAPFAPSLTYLEMDFTVNMKEICPPPAGTPSLVPWKVTPPPATSYVDIATPVGVDANGDIILLAKAFGPTTVPKYVMDEGTFDQTYGNVLFYAFTSRGPADDTWKCSCSWDAATNLPILDAEYNYQPLLDITRAGINSFARFFSYATLNTVTAKQTYLGKIANALTFKFLFE